MAFTPLSASGTEQGPPLSATLHWRINKGDIRRGASVQHPPGKSQACRAAGLLFRRFWDRGTDEHTDGFGGAVPGPRWRRQTAGQFRGRGFQAVRSGLVPHPPGWSSPGWPGFWFRPR